MELRDYWRVFRRRVWIPALLAAAAVLTASVLAYFSKPSYTASATVLAKVGSDNAAAVVSFPTAALSNTVAVGVIQRLNLNESVDQFGQHIKVMFAGGNLYRVSATGATPDRTAAIANEVARQATALYLQQGPQTSNFTVDAGLAKARDDLQQRYLAAVTTWLKFQAGHPNSAASKDATIAAQGMELQLEEEAAAADYRGVLDQITHARLGRIAAVTGFDARVLDQAVARPDNSGRVAQVLSAAALALAAGTALIFLLEYVDNAIREPEAAEAIVGAPVIGVIPKANPQSLRAIKGGV